MNPTHVDPSSDFERRLAGWLDDQAPMHEPHGLTYAVLARTRRMHRMPRWASPERWLSMAVITRPALAPPLRAAWLTLIALLILALAAGGAIVGSRLFQVSAYPIPQGGAAVLAFDGGGDIFTVRADGTDLRQLTSGPDLETVPAWSPDGTRLAYRLWQDGSDSVTVMDAGGGSRTILATTSQPSADCVWSPAWSPDGTSLIYSTTSSPCRGPSEIFIVAADGSSPATRLLAPGLNTTNAAAWSPDGTQIAFLGTAAGESGVYVADVATGGALAGGLEARRITEAGMDWYLDDRYVPQWSPDGTKLTAMAGTNGICSATSGTWDAYVVKADGSGQRALSEDPADEFTPTWAPDGRQLAFLRIVGASELLNDGDWVCTTAPWVIDADGTNERRLDGSLGFDFGPSPVWSPDGTRVAGLFLEVTPDGEPTPAGIHIITVDGSSPLVIVPTGGGNFSSWQPVAAPLPPAPSFAAVSPSP